MIINKKIDDKIRNFLIKQTYQMGKSNLGNLPKLSYSEVTNITDKYMNIISKIITFLQTFALGFVLLWYIPIIKGKGYMPSIAGILFLIYIIMLLQNKQKTKSI